MSSDFTKILPLLFTYELIPAYSDSSFVLFPVSLYVFFLLGVFGFPPLLFCMLFLFRVVMLLVTGQYHGWVFLLASGLATETQYVISLFN